MTTERSGKAAVLGAGIGGLTAANALLRHGWHVDVFERSAALPETGTVGLWPEALDALATAGLRGAAEAQGVLQSSGTMRRWDGKVIARLDAIRRPAVLLSRPALLGLLADGVPPGTIRFGRPAPPPTELTGYDVVIAADGIGSPTRDLLFGAGYRPVYTGLSAWRGWVAGTTDDMSESWGPGALFGITPRDGDLTNWFAAVRAPAGSTGGLDDLRNRYRHWHPAVRDVLERVEPATVLHHDLYESPRLPSYVHGTVALIGDAAHAMAPNLGRGACEAMVDGATLATLLAEHPVPDALRRYDRARRAHTQRLVTASHLMSRITTARRATGVRNAILAGALRFA